MKGDIAVAGYRMTAEEWQALDPWQRAELVAVITRKDDPELAAGSGPIPLELEPDPESGAIPGLSTLAADLDSGALLNRGPLAADLNSGAIPNRTSFATGTDAAALMNRGPLAVGLDSGAFVMIPDGLAAVFDSGPVIIIEEPAAADAPDPGTAEFEFDFGSC